MNYPKCIFIALGLLLVTGCGRHVDDRMSKASAPVEPIGYTERPSYAVVATKKVPTARVVGNYVLITNGEQPVYVMPNGYQHARKQYARSQWHASSTEHVYVQYRFHASS